MRVLVLASVLVLAAGCGGGGGSGGSSKDDYGKVVKHVAGVYREIADSLGTAASGGAEGWTAIADKLHGAAAELRSIKPPTAESKKPLAALLRDVSTFEADARKVAAAGGALSAGGTLVDKINADAAAMGDDISNLPLY